ncbi:AarF/UbiB family protein [Nostoc flagelliforme]|uniref:AarF/UbiB family protein n=1 Tax=Nostoc flagelliforme TaxID=1306274 RepID=UPI003BAF08D9
MHDALTAIHQNSIVHHDLHYGNIRLRSGNKLILIDFSLFPPRKRELERSLFYKIIC